MSLVMFLRSHWNTSMVTRSLAFFWKVDLSNYSVGVFFWMSIFTSKGFFETFFLENNVSNIFGRIVPKSGEFAW
jgi:hypothetical protein